MSCNSPISSMPLADMHSHFDLVADPATLAAEAAGAHVMKVDTVYDVNYDNIRAHLARFDSEEGGVRP